MDNKHLCRYCHDDCDCSGYDFFSCLGCWACVANDWPDDDYDDDDWGV